MAEEPRQPKSVNVKTEWPESFDDIPTLYANQLFVTHATGSEFYLIFGEVSPPTLIDPTPEELEALVARGARVRVIAKIAVSPQTMLKFAEAISTNVEGFKERSRIVFDPANDEGESEDTRE